MAGYAQVGGSSSSGDIDIVFTTPTHTPRTEEKARVKDMVARGTAGRDARLREAGKASRAKEKFDSANIKTCATGEVPLTGSRFHDDMIKKGQKYGLLEVAPKSVGMPKYITTIEKNPDKLERGRLAMGLPARSPEEMETARRKYVDPRRAGDNMYARAWNTLRRNYQQPAGERQQLGAEALAHRANLKSSDALVTYEAVRTPGNIQLYRKNSSIGDRIQGNARDRGGSPQSRREMQLNNPDWARDRPRATQNAPNAIQWLFNRASPTIQRVGQGARRHARRAIDGAGNWELFW